MATSSISASFWAGRRVLVTGHTGFMGGWLVATLKQLGAQISGYSLPAPTNPSFYETMNVAAMLADETLADIRDLDGMRQAIQNYKPEFVFHLAAQPIVREAFRNPFETFSANVMGTASVLEAIRACKDVKAVIVVTSDKVYQNDEFEWDFRENDRLGGREAYGVSKACCELVLDAYRHSYLQPAGVQVASVRAGNVIGGGDWAADRLIPDIVRCFSTGEPLRVRSPNATRPWQHVLEPIRGYLLLGERMLSKPDAYCGGWNFGPERDSHKPVSWIADHCVKEWGDGAKWLLENEVQPYEAKRLGVTSSLAESKLGWVPRWPVEMALSRSLSWYRAALSGKSMTEQTAKDIADAVL